MQITADNKELNIQIYEIMIDIGISPDMLGYHYSSWIIHRILVGDFDITDKMMYMYEVTANNFNTTPSRVEKAIRHSIECAFLTMSADISDKYFGNIVSYEKSKVMNKQFITLVAQHIRVHEM